MKRTEQISRNKASRGTYTIRMRLETCPVIKSPSLRSCKVDSTSMAKNKGQGTEESAT